MQRNKSMTQGVGGAEIVPEKDLKVNLAEKDIKAATLMF